MRPARLPAELEPVLTRWTADCRPGGVQFLAGAGGMSGARLWRLQTPRGELALRRWPAEHPSPERLRLIHAVIRHATARGCEFLAPPLPELSGETFVLHEGHLWELAPWLPGAADFHANRSAERLRAALTALARFHLAVESYSHPGVGPAPAVIERTAQCSDLLYGAGRIGLEIGFRRASDLAPWTQADVETIGRLVPVVAAQLAAVGSVTVPLIPCLRDVWHDHVLYWGERVTGLIDYGATRIDTVATDLTRLLGSLVGDDPHGWNEGLDAYQRVRPLAAHELALLPALDASGIVLACVNWIQWICVEGRTFAGPAVQDRLAAVVARLRNLADGADPHTGGRLGRNLRPGSAE